MKIKTPSDRALEQRFAPEQMIETTAHFLQHGPYGDTGDLLDDKEFAVLLVDPQGDYGDLGKAPETTVFASVFNRRASRVYREYEEYDDRSTFIVAFDLHDQGGPRPAGSIRVIHGADDPLELKSVKDLVADSRLKNPWRRELGRTLFERSGLLGRREKYDARVAWLRLCEKAGVELEASETHDVATLAVFDEYTKKDAGHTEMNAPSLLLYHTCLRFALEQGMKNLVSIQDVIPFQILQSYGEPFDTMPVKPRKYGGPYPTIPAYCVLQEGMRRIRENNPYIADVFIHGQGIRDLALLLEDVQPDIYGDEKVGLAA